MGSSAGVASNAIPHPKVFVSHSSADKDFVRLLVADLKDRDVDVWFDETALGLGDSIVGKISDAIRDTNYLIVVLSKSSIASPWVQQELNAALMHQLSDKGMLVLPIRLDDCEVPAILKDRVYADIKAGYKEVVEKIVRVLKMETSQPLVSAIDGVVTLPPVSGPNHCPSKCMDALKNVHGHDLRRVIQSCLQLKHLKITWHAVFGERLDDAHPNADLQTAAFEMVMQANELGLIDKLKRELCEDHPHFFNAKCK
ncbi:MAG: toll/interleukin-1 receptor domain-containing protein [Planctomycetota bacterium]|nr:toll/interleukin-1 receptor domain-containing protein [Planctomycetaceae bacterium]MDQ3330383.1 toll/interleukin-1 receptor domain-containing protein [Planctomycetota bacterium]